MADWPIITLREAGVELIDCVHKTPAATPEGIPYVAIPQMKNGKIDFSDARRISQDDYKEWTKKARPKLHDVVLSRRTNPGVTATFGTDCEFALGQNLVLLRADGKRVLPEFLRWLTAGPVWWEQINKFLNVGAVFDSLKCADVPNFELPIPPKSNQEVIASILSALEDKIDLNRRMNETLEAMARAIFMDWFVDFGPTRAKMEGRSPYLSAEIWSLFPDRLDGDGNPEGWRNCQFGDLCARIAIGPFGSDITTDNFVETGVPVIRGINLRTGFIDDKFVFITNTKADTLKNANAFPGDIIITHRGTLGQVGLIPEVSRFPRYVASQSQMLATANPSLANPQFLFEFLRSAVGQERLLANTSQTGVPAIARPTTSLRSIRLVRPPALLLSAFEDTTTSISRRSVANEGENRTLSSIRDLLLPKLMSGAIRIRDAEKVVEAVL